MAESKYTPGPWGWHETEDSLIGFAGIFVIRDYGPYEGLAINDFDRVTPEVAEANKRLIAAAPELLEALKEVLAVSDRDHIAWHKAHIAIAKAEGAE